MSELKRQARRLSELFAKLAEKETYFEHIDDCHRWNASSQNPCMLNDLSLWRVAEPKRKIIDLSVCIKSNIDMEFRDHSNWFTDKLKNITKDVCEYPEVNKTIYQSITLFTAHKCRIRQKHWHSWNGGKRPIPEGLAGAIRLRDKTVEYLSIANKWVHDNASKNKDIIAFWIDGPAENYKYEWEE